MWIFKLLELQNLPVWDLSPTFRAMEGWRRLRQEKTWAAHNLLTPRPGRREVELLESAGSRKQTPVVNRPAPSSGHGRLTGSAWARDTIRIMCSKILWHPGRCIKWLGDKDTTRAWILQRASPMEVVSIAATLNLPPPLPYITKRKCKFNNSHSTFVLYTPHLTFIQLNSTLKVQTTILIYMYYVSIACDCVSYIFNHHKIITFNLRFQCFF